MKKQKVRWKPPPPFSVMVEYKGFDHERDKAICAAVGRRHDGAGFSFTEGWRDLEFGFHRRTSAIAAAKRAKQLGGVNATVTGRVWP